METITRDNITDTQFDTLCTITTRDESGRHFMVADRYVMWDVAHLETLGLIAIDRPVHIRTGIPYGHEEWTVEITPLGQQFVDNNT